MLPLLEIIILEKRRKKRVSAMRKIPFQSEKGLVEFSLRPLRDLVFVFPDPPPEKLGEEQLIHIPESYRKKYHNGSGTILAAGLGYTDNKGRFHPTSSELKPGTRVIFDISVPWGVDVTGSDGKKHYVILCGTTDIFGLVGKEEGQN